MPDLRVGETVPLLDISRAWLVDPVGEREGPGEIVVRDGILEAVTWLEGAEAARASQRMREAQSAQRPHWVATPSSNCRHSRLTAPSAAAWRIC